MSHAAGFAILAYASSWVKRHHPDVFLAALLNSQPMGFYAPAQLVDCARRHGVEVRPVCVNASRWGCTLEPSSTSTGGFAVRLGLLMAGGLRDREGARLVAARADKPFATVEELRRRTGLGAGALGRLADVDALRALGLARREAAWAVRALRDSPPLPLFAAADAREGGFAPEVPEPAPALEPATAGREVVDDYGATGLSLRAHPLAFLRAALGRRGVTPSEGLAAARDGRRVRVAGLVLVRQRPGSAKGVLFLTLEDETGPLNVIVWPALFERHRRTVLTAGMVGVEGRVQKEGSVVHVVAERLVDLSAALRRVGERGAAAFPLPRGRGDEARGGGGGPDRRGGAPPLGAAPQDTSTSDLLTNRGRGGIEITPRNFR